LIAPPVDGLTGRPDDRRVVKHPPWKRGREGEEPPPRPAAIAGSGCRQAARYYDYTI